MKYVKSKYVIAMAGWLFVSYSVFFFIHDDQKIIFLTKEDGVFETAGAVFFLLSAIIFFTIFLKNRKNSQRSVFKNIFFLLLACVFLFAFLEEISWGQRIFNLSTPQFLQKINKQGEINIHNIWIFDGHAKDGTKKTGLALMLSMERLFSIFLITYCFLLPVLYNLYGRAKRVLDRIDFPIVPMVIGTVFLLNYLLAKIIIFQIDSRLLHRSVTEIKECNVAVLLFIISIWFIRTYNAGPTPRSPKVTSSQNQ